MNYTEQSLKIGKALGWKLTYDNDLSLFRVYNPSGVFVGFEKYEQKFIDYLPDYHNDLNAILKAELVLLPRDAKLYVKLLMGIVWRDDPFENRGILFATANQRAEALLRSLQLWDK